MDPATILTTVLQGVLLGAVYGAYGYATKKKPGEQFEPKKFGRTVFVWGAAGAIVALEPTQAVSEGSVEEKAAAIGAVGIFFDFGWQWVDNHAGAESEGA